MISGGNLLGSTSGLCCDKEGAMGDWRAHLQQMHLAITSWSTLLGVAGRQEVIRFTTKTVHRSGQSLGGGLSRCAGQPEGDR